MEEKGLRAQRKGLSLITRSESGFGPFKWNLKAKEGNDRGAREENGQQRLGEEF